jgi:hypothetical protein
MGGISSFIIMNNNECPLCDIVGKPTHTIITVYKDGIFDNYHKRQMKVSIKTYEKLMKLVEDKKQNSGLTFYKNPVECNHEQTRTN